VGEPEQGPADASASGAPVDRARDGASPFGVYSPDDRLRFLPERPKQSRRGPFARDRARVVHSSALRRLAGKTQVVGPGTDDFVRNRLTHSLEVAQIGRDLALALGCDADVVEAACLAHDLGHPPFGHNGEEALDHFAADVGGFEGNAQTLRVLTRLEPKVVDVVTGAPGGLNLTRAVLDATAKYPWPRTGDTSKYGVYADDLAAFDWLRERAPQRRRCLEAQVMDWADDVAYSVHDLEDGIHSGQIRLGALADAEERAELCELAAEWYSPESPAGLSAALDDLLRLPTLRDVGGYDGTLPAQAALKRATSELTGRFVEAAARATREAAGDGPLLRYAADLVVPRRIAAECALLKGVAARYVMLRPEAAARQARQREVLAELVDLLADRAPDALEAALRPDWRSAPDDAGRLRVVIDQVAGLTDRSAVGWHARLTGAAGRPAQPATSTGRKP
jgi:dGTPase